MKVLVSKSCSPLCNPIYYNLLGSSVHGILQARILEWVAILFSKVFSQPRDGTWVSHIAGGFFASCATREAQWVQGDQDEVAEWSRGWSANPLCSACVGSNPILLHLRLPRPAFSLGLPSGGSGFQWGKKKKKKPFLPMQEMKVPSRRSSGGGHGNPL